MRTREAIVAFSLVLILQSSGFAAKKLEAKALKSPPPEKTETLEKFKGTCQSRKLVPNASSCRGEGGIMGTYHQVGDSCVCTKFH